ncbi:MAG TPA: phospholipase D family protein [Solirubrobacterales bacterium]
MSTSPEGFRLVRSGWDGELRDGLLAGAETVRIVSPFIQRRAAKRLLAQAELRVITRFNLADFADGVSDLAALRLLLDHGAQIRGVKGLHAKLYLFGSLRAIVTSANLTEAALLNNHELGFVATNESIVADCGRYFDHLWERGVADLSSKRLEGWEADVQSHLARFPRRAPARRLPDEGAEVADAEQAPPLPPLVEESSQAFVKFFGESHRRAPRSQTTLASLHRSGCHWSCTYPRDKRPRSVKDGAVMYMGWLVEDPNDIMVFGRGIAMRYRDELDDASAEDVALRSWREKWPHYIRVRDVEFIDGTLANGISLYELMDELGPDSFATTQANTRSGGGNTNPRHSYGRQAAVRLSVEGRAWLNDGLQSVFETHGRLGDEAMDELDWPSR